MSEATTQAEGAGVVIGGPSRFRRAAGWFGWTWLGLMFLAIFTLFKLPDARLKNFIQGQISSALAPYGIGFGAETGHLSVAFGVNYRMEGVTLSPPPPSPMVKIDRVAVSPGIFGLIAGRMGGSLDVENAGGEAQIDGYVTGKTRSEFQVSFNLKHLDLGKLGIPALAAGIQASALASGKGKLSGDMNNPSTLNGELHLNLQKIVIDQQSIQGFSVPKLEISTAQADVVIDHGKAIIRTFKLGKPGSQDDLIADVTGDVVLGKQIEASTLNLKTKFRFSEKIQKAFVLIDALLQQGKQADGSYAYDLSGPLMSPVPTPHGK